MQKQADWTNCKNVLCIRQDNLGDVLMTSPAIRALKKSVPGRKITLLASNAGQGIARFIPEIDEVIVFDTPWEKNAFPGSEEKVLRTVQQLKSHKFDAAVIFTVYSQNPLPAAMLCYLAGIPKVAGFCRENPYHLMTDWVPDPEPLFEIRHEVERQLELVKNLGATLHNDYLSLQTSEAAAEITFKILESKGIDSTLPWMVIHPGVSEPKRQYPAELLAKAVQKIIDEFGFPILLTGVAAERSLTEYIAKTAGSGAISLAGELNLEQLISLIANSEMLISNNTGPAHIAAAVKTPVVVLYALTNPQHAPWNVPQVILPFEVPEEMRSKNAIIRFAHEKSFQKQVEAVTPDRICEAAKELRNNYQTTEKTQVIRL